MVTEEGSMEIQVVEEKTQAFLHHLDEDRTPDVDDDYTEMWAEFRIG